jgi:hypothetical protein
MSLAAAGPACRFDDLRERPGVLAFAQEPEGVQPHGIPLVECALAQEVVEDLRERGELLPRLELLHQDRALRQHRSSFALAIQPPLAIVCCETHVAAPSLSHIGNVAEFGHALRNTTCIASCAIRWRVSVGRPILASAASVAEAAARCTRHPSRCW